ncbi:MAG: hypothetical protein ACI8UD_001459 [Planctomycetota bacterium]|jgi:hypothetical protein
MMLIANAFAFTFGGATGRVRGSARTLADTLTAIATAHIEQHLTTYERTGKRGYQHGVRAIHPRREGHSLAIKTVSPSANVPSRTAT